jgi:glutamate racemase
MIGVFDSGSGGLTVLRKIQDAMPKADVLYFGDIKNAPYGTRSQEELADLTTQAITRLLAGGAKNIVSACNSVSASLAISLSDPALAAVPMVEMIAPTAAHFEDSQERILICATTATVSSGIYQNAFRMSGKEIGAIDIPELAGAIEFGEPKEQLKRYIQTAFSKIDLNDFDTLVLACTHFPLVTGVFEEVVGGSLKIFDPAEAVANRAKELFGDEVESGSITFLISQNSEPFRERVAELFPHIPHTIEVVK